MIVVNGGRTVWDFLALLLKIVAATVGIGGLILGGLWLMA